MRVKYPARNTAAEAARAIEALLIGLNYSEDIAIALGNLAQSVCLAEGAIDVSESGSVDFAHDSAGLAAMVNTARREIDRQTGQ